MRHLLITRLATGRPDHGWLKSRLEIFEQYCVKSIKKQTCQNFVWLLALHPNVPDWFISKVQSLVPSAKLVFSNSKSIYPEWTKLIPDELIDKVLLTTRIDNDDAIHETFMEEVQRLASNLTDNCVLNAPLGYMLDQRSFACCEFKRFSNHFISLLEFGTAKTVCAYDHTKISETYRIIDFCENKNLWLEGINGRNLINTMPKNGVPVNWASIKSNFI